ncbi:MAG TPA: HDOD domain-containing protein [Gemmatimonas sp.]|uniref:EAL and HDOD domain-containing protein n=1 Tax=Gemmatimonas sp. TaxID=1962908 RepID=UPI002ED87A7B
MPVHDVEVTPPPTAQHVFIARQPIFDRTPHRVAYELLYRASREATAAATELSATFMCGDTALHALLSIGLERLTAGTKAFVNITEDHLLGDLYKIFDSQAVVLELLESIDGTPAVVDACERAIAEGYVLALDDYDGRASLDPLLPLASIVKVDVLPHTRTGTLQALAPLVARLKGFGLTVLAERVETAEELAECKAMGFDLFQGYVFSRPETLDGRAANVHQAAVFQIVSMLNEPRVTERDLENAFRVHPSLSFTLLRIVNSASFGGRSVDSISHAIRLVGREALSRWMIIMLVASVGSRSAVAHEAVMTALVRGRFCEEVSAHAGHADPSARFLVGLLSRMDVLLGLPMEQVLERLPVSQDVRDALLLSTGPHADVLRLADAYERADWDLVEQEVPGMRAVFTELYTESVIWSGDRLASAAPQ